MAARKRADACSLCLSAAFSVAAFLAPFPSSSHPQPGAPRARAFYCLTRFATACAPCALFHRASFYPLLLLCLFMLRLLLLLDIFRDELQSTAGKKRGGGSSFGNVRPASFIPSHFHEDLFFSLQDLILSLTPLSSHPYLSMSFSFSSFFFNPVVISS